MYFSIGVFLASNCLRPGEDELLDQEVGEDWENLHL